MVRVINQRELRNDSGEIMRQLDRGETFVVTRRGVAVGELTPLRGSRFVRRERLDEVFRGAPPVDAQQLRRDLDAYVDQGAKSRA